MSEEKRKVLMSKTKEISPKKDLGGEILFETEDGTFNKILIPFCDVCQTNLGNEIIICSLGQHKTCPDCSVNYEQKNICIDCLKNKIQLSKRQFKILTSIFSGICWKRGLHSITHMARPVIEKTISELIQAGYVQKKRTFWLEITDTGMEVLVTYRTVYPKDIDVQNLNWELRRRERV